MKKDDLTTQIKKLCQALAQMTGKWEKEVVPTVTAIINKLDENELRFRQLLQEAAIAINKAIDNMPDFLELTRPISAISVLGDAQFVTWEFMHKPFVDEVLESHNINKTLRLYYEKEHYQSVFETAEKCKGHPIIGSNKKVYEQAISAFRAGHTDIAVIGLTATLDGALSVASEKLITSIPKRVEEFLNKIRTKKTVTPREISIFSLLSTFQKSMAIFGADSDFHKPEPKNLNRHWIAHGRSYRKKTKLDCVKLIHMLYAIILLDGGC